MYAGIPCKTLDIFVAGRAELFAVLRTAAGELESRKVMQLAGYEDGFEQVRQTKDSICRRVERACQQAVIPSSVAADDCA